MATPELSKEMNPSKDDFLAMLDETLAEDVAYEGNVVRGKIVAIEKDIAVIDVGLKMEGRVPLKEFGIGGKPDFWIGVAPGGAAATPTHVALHAARRSLVKAFYEAAIAAGGTDNGPPGTRPIYHEHYYGAFVRDPDGHNIEAVCHDAYLG